VELAPPRIAPTDFEQLSMQWMRDVNFFERELARLELRLDVFDECRYAFSASGLSVWHVMAMYGARIPRRARRKARSNRAASVRDQGRICTAQRDFPTGRIVVRFAAIRQGQWLAERIFAACVRAISQNGNKFMRAG